jgi:Lipase maturation factor
MPFEFSSVTEWLLGPSRGGPGKLWPRWLWLRALGLIFFSAFYSYAFQVRGLIGPHGILPAITYLKLVANHLGAARYWYAPTLLWFGAGPAALNVVWITGMAGSVLLVLNVWPRAAIAVCFVAYLSFVSVGQDFSSYQSDGMLLAAGFLSLFVAPPGVRPRLGPYSPPSRAAVFMLQWLWFRIYFESGVVKLASHDPDWRHLTALYEYYQNGPLPNWIGWYAQQLPHGLLAALALCTLTIELGVVWFLFLQRRLRLACFFIVTPFQIGIILTANLAFLNYLVLSLGVLLLDDKFILAVTARVKQWTTLFRHAARPTQSPSLFVTSGDAGPKTTIAVSNREPSKGGGWAALRHGTARVATGITLGWIFYATFAELVILLVGAPLLPEVPIAALEPFRIAEQYGLFAVMTRARYEIEFQGSYNGRDWTPYPFCYKPQRIDEAPRIYAPYQPRFDWNLWFASLGSWTDYPWVVRTEELLLENDASVLILFAGNPFQKSPPNLVRAVEWQYWFTDLKTKRATGDWWRRQYRGLYAPMLKLDEAGKPVVVEWPAQP